MVVCNLYADDIKLYSTMRTVNDCKNLQESQNALCLAIVRLL